MSPTHHGFVTSELWSLCVDRKTIAKGKDLIPCSMMAVSQGIHWPYKLGAFVDELIITSKNTNTKEPASSARHIWCTNFYASSTEIVIYYREQAQQANTKRSLDNRQAAIGLYRFTLNSGSGCGSAIFGNPSDTPTPETINQLTQHGKEAELDLFQFL
jgi:hypothetical protein